MSRARQSSTDPVAGDRAAVGTGAAESVARVAHTYLDLTRLLDEVERVDPQTSAALRLELVRARRQYAAGRLEPGRFGDLLLELRSVTAARVPWLRPGPVAESSPQLV